MFRNKKTSQEHERKYIGVVLHINGFDYFAPLSSFKAKHHSMSEKQIDFIKVKEYAAINLNNMFPIPKDECQYVNIEKEKDVRYQNLLRAEYRYIKSIQEKIRKNAQVLYKHKSEKGNTTGLGKRCNDFSLLEKLCNEYKSADNGQ